MCGRNLMVLSLNLLNDETHKVAKQQAKSLFRFEMSHAQLIPVVNFVAISVHNVKLGNNEPNIIA
ncbi:MAG: hypothetical protein ACTS43_00305 [Candidatus Hodgkinia cicadicola]